MSERKERKITVRTTKSTLHQLDQRNKTMDIIKGIINEEIPEFAEEHFVLDPAELDSEIRFGVKKRRSTLL